MNDVVTNVTREENRKKKKTRTRTTATTKRQKEKETANSQNNLHSSLGHSLVATSMGSDIMSIFSSLAGDEPMYCCRSLRLKFLLSPVNISSANEFQPPSQVMEPFLHQEYQPSVSKEERGLCTAGDLAPEEAKEHVLVVEKAVTTDK